MPGGGIPRSRSRNIDRAAVTSHSKTSRQRLLAGRKFNIVAEGFAWVCVNQGDVEETCSYRKTCVLRVPSVTAGRFDDAQKLLAASMDKFHLSCLSEYLRTYSADFIRGIVILRAYFEVEGVRNWEDCGEGAHLPRSGMTIVAGHKAIATTLMVRNAVEEKISCAKQ